MTIQEILIRLIPFTIELIGDWYLIKKKKPDIQLWARCIMVLIVSIDYDDRRIYVPYTALATAPFMLFDPALNLLRGFSWKREGKTKKYDLFINQFNPYFVLSIRVLLLTILLIYAL